MGSSLPRSAILVRSLPKLSSTGVLDFESVGFFDDGEENGSSSSLLLPGNSALGPFDSSRIISYSSLAFSYMIPYLFNILHAAQSS